MLLSLTGPAGHAPAIPNLRSAEPDAYQNSCGACRGHGAGAVADSGLGQVRPPGGCDHGGNEVKVTWFGKPTNLHAVWDSSIVDEEQLSFSELAAKLERHISPADVIAWSDVNPLDWVSESAGYRDKVYPTAADMPKPAKGKKRKKHEVVLPDLSYSY